MPIRQHIFLTTSSVVFASVYRFTVLFSYSASDPTYTLATTVVWTAIEMSAGITSACLPTIRPAVQLIARRLGIKSSLSGLLRHGDSKDLSRNSRSANIGTLTIEQSNLEHARKGSQGAGVFYRLSDRNDSTGSEGVSIPMDAKLRPEHGYAYTVSSVPGHGDRESMGGEVPFNRIVVQKDFNQTTN